jgi:hypothetical protein
MRSDRGRLTALIYVGRAHSYINATAEIIFGFEIKVNFVKLLIKFLEIFRATQK